MTLPIQEKELRSSANRSNGLNGYKYKAEVILKLNMVSIIILMCCARASFAQYYSQQYLHNYSPQANYHTLTPQHYNNYYHQLQYYQQEQAKYHYYQQLQAHNQQLARYYQQYYNQQQQQQPTTAKPEPATTAPHYTHYFKVTNIQKVVELNHILGNGL